MTDRRSREAVEVGEAYADGRATRQEADGAAEASGTAHEALFQAMEALPAGAKARLAAPTAWCATGATRWVAALVPAEVMARLVTSELGLAVRVATGEGGADTPAGRAALAELMRTHSDLFREVFGNPFRPPPSVFPAWLVWNGADEITTRRRARGAGRPAAGG